MTSKQCLFSNTRVRKTSWWWISLRTNDNIRIKGENIYDIEEEWATDKQKEIDEINKSIQKNTWRRWAE